VKRPDFDEIGRAAATLLEVPVLPDEAVEIVAAEARRATPFVPHRRRGDWGKLVEGFRKRETTAKRRARIEGLLRACALFADGAVATPRRTPRTGPIALEDRVDVLPGLGPTGAATLAEHGVRDVGDLLLSVPRTAVDLRAPLVGEDIFTELRAVAERPHPLAIRGTVERASMVFLRGRRGVRAAMKSDGVALELWWFFASKAALSLRGEIVAIGVPRPDPKRPRVLRIAHPRTVPLARCGGVEPIYAFRGVQSSRVSRAVREALARVDLEKLDPVPAAHRDSEALADILRKTHAPTTPEEHIEGRVALRERMAFAEACWLVSRRIEREKSLGLSRAPRLPPHRKSHAALMKAFGFVPTSAQVRAMSTIAARLDEDTPSRTLLTGDVGTGKTAVLLAAAAQAVASKRQVAILAPTTILADQYLQAAEPLARATGARIALLPSASGKERSIHARVSEAAKKGDLDVVVGTHALLQGSVSFARLGLVIVDEQHRLGVAQRLSLVGKGRATEAPHLLSVSATPIPRTLALALRGEIATAHLDERPSGRSTPETTVLPRGDFSAAIDALRACLDRGEQAFVVCATIDPLTGDEDEAIGAKERAEQLASVFGPEVALIHGSLEGAACRRAIAAFRRGESRVLVGTSMLEVGIDVPAATLIVVDSAERFGLAQLHQLRGRVGRGDRPGRCLLLHGEPLGDTARARLAALCRANDGLEVARADLRLRGAGDLEGARQSGEASGMRFLDPIGDEAIVARASAAMREILAADPELRDASRAGLRRAFARFDEYVASQGIARGEAG